MNFKHYRVTITNPGETTQPGNGFIDPKNAEMYYAEGDTVANYDAAVVKERANVRWLHTIFKFSELVTPQVSSIDSDGTANDEPTSLSFTLIYDRPDYLQTQDETTAPGEAPSFLSGADAIKRLIARGLCDTVNSRRQIMSPVDHTSAMAQDLLMLVTGPIAEDVETAEVLISVEEIENI